MLAAVSLGATWSSCSPDFGLQGVLDRFGQIEPKVLIACESYFYNGKIHDIREKIASLSREIPSIQRVVVVPYAGADPNIRFIPEGVHLLDYVRDIKPCEISFAQMPFDHPLYILYSSGTTGQPN